MDSVFSWPDVQPRRSDRKLAERTQEFRPHHSAICDVDHRLNCHHNNPARHEIPLGTGRKRVGSSVDDLLRHLPSASCCCLVSITLSFHTKSLFHVLFALCCYASFPVVAANTHLACS